MFKAFRESGAFRTFKQFHDAIMEQLWRSLKLVLAVWATLVFVGVTFALYA